MDFLGDLKTQKDILKLIDLQQQQHQINNFTDRFNDICNGHANKPQVEKDKRNNQIERTFNFQQGSI